MASLKFEHCLIIGGCGFLGQHLCEALLEKGYKVSVFDIRKSFENEKVKFYIGNLCIKQDLLEALVGVDCVFHCATVSPLSNNKELFFKVNYEGTKTVIEACKEAGVKKFVLTSSASVVYEGKDLSNATEDLPYAVKPLDYYTETKILQEKEVLKANSSDFFTVALRPHGIFGPRDPHLVPTTVELAKAGKNKFIVGDGKNVVDFTFVTNVVQGHILAAEQIGPNSQINGNAYFLTNDEPLFFWTFLSKILVGLGYKAPKYHLPFTVIYFIAVVIQMFCALLKPFKEIHTSITPFAICVAATHHFYCCKKAITELGYKPSVSVEEGIQKTLEYFSYLKKETDDVKE